MFILTINNTGDLKIQGSEACISLCTHAIHTTGQTAARAVPTEGLTVENRKVGGGQERKIREQKIWK